MRLPKPFDLLVKTFYVFLGAFIVLQIILLLHLLL